MWLAAFKAPPKGTSVQAFAPLFPGSRQERWYFFLADVPKNITFSIKPESLLAAEAASVVQRFHREPSDSGEAEEEGGGSHRLV